MLSTSKPDTYAISDLAKLPAALEDLTLQVRWVVWKRVPRTDKKGRTKWTKPPYRVDNPSLQAKSNDPET